MMLELDSCVWLQVQDDCEALLSEVAHLRCAGVRRNSLTSCFSTPGHRMHPRPYAVARVESQASRREGENYDYLLYHIPDMTSLREPEPGHQEEASCVCAWMTLCACSGMFDASMWQVRVRHDVDGHSAQPMTLAEFEFSNVKKGTASRTAYLDQMMSPGLKMLGEEIAHDEATRLPPPRVRI